MSGKPKAPRYKDGRELEAPRPSTTPKAMNEAARKLWAEPGPHIMQAVLAAQSAASAPRAKGGRAPRRTAIALARKVHDMAARGTARKKIAADCGTTTQNVGLILKAPRP